MSTRGQDDAPDPKLIARVIAHLAAPRMERVRIAAVTKQVEEPKTVRRPVERSEERDVGPARWVWVATGILAVLGLLLAVNNQVVVGIVLLAASAGGYSWASRKFRRIEMQQVTAYEEAVQIITREVIAEPERFEERQVANQSKVILVGRISVPFVCFSLGGNTVLFGSAGVGKGRVYKYPVPVDSAGLRDRMDFLDEATASVPFVLSEQTPPPSSAEPIQDSHSVLRGLERSVADAYVDAGRMFQSLKHLEFLLQPIDPRLPGLDLLEPCAIPIAVPGLDDAIALKAFLDGPVGEHLESRSKASIEEWTDRQFATSGVRFDSLHLGLAPVCYGLGRMFDLSAFNFYCPDCAREQNDELLRRDYSVAQGEERSPMKYSPNSRCLFDTERQLWRCMACEGEFENAIPMHRTLDEVLLPAYDRLMEENKNERLDVYARARDSELDYANRRETELEEIFRTNREGVELLRREELRAQADIQGEQVAITSLLGVVAAAKVSTAGALTRVSEETRQLTFQMEQDRAGVRREMAEFYERERAEMVKTMNDCARAERIEQVKRDSVMREINVNMVGLRQDVQKGFSRIEGAVRETTAAVREGTATLATKMQEQTASLSAKMDEQTKELRGISSIEAARAKREGLNIGPTWLSPFKKLKAEWSKATDFGGDAMSEAAIDLENRK